VTLKYQPSGLASGLVATAIALALSVLVWTRPVLGEPPTVLGA
jgi:hypothetical protein